MSVGLTRGGSEGGVRVCGTVPNLRSFLKHESGGKSMGTEGMTASGSQADQAPEAARLQTILYDLAAMALLHGMPHDPQRLEQQRQIWTAAQEAAAQGRCRVWAGDLPTLRQAQSLPIEPDAAPVQAAQCRTAGRHAGSHASDRAHAGRCSPCCGRVGRGTAHRALRPDGARRSWHGRRRCERGRWRWLRRPRGAAPG